MSRDYLLLVSTEAVWEIVDALGSEQRIRLETGPRLEQWEHGYAKALKEVGDRLFELHEFKVKKEHLGEPTK